jgi:heme-degrading monooxygenase HmoA
MQLAQLNIARWTVDPTGEIARGFVERLDEVNGLAEAADGFVWRLKDDAGNSLSYRLFDDPRLIINLSVWESIDQLKRFTYQGAHREVFRQRHDWFEESDQATSVLWWVPDGHHPDLEEAGAKLVRLRAFGVSDKAFDFAYAARLAVGERKGSADRE